MTNYLDYQFEDSETFINTFDEAPLWSASFGLLLLKHLELKSNQTVIDIGSGAGFPLFELAGRMGNSCKLFGVDTWTNANQRALQKIKNYQYSNVEIISCSANKMPFENNSIDLIVSNLGINNFNNPNEVFSECNRVLKPNGMLTITTNMNGHWQEFYQVFYATLKQLNKHNLVEKLEQEEAHRGNKQTISEHFTKNGFKINQSIEDQFEMKFLDGSAFLNHHFVKLGWLTSWMNLIDKQDLKEVFSNLESNLNLYAQLNNGLNLTVPMLFIEGEKQ
jgi:arsenite methyltransferase